jgi:hypothetical protein
MLLLMELPNVTKAPTIDNSSPADKRLGLSASASHCALCRTSLCTHEGLHLTPRTIKAVLDRCPEPHGLGKVKLPQMQG